MTQSTTLAGYGCLLACQLIIQSNKPEGKTT